MTFQLSINEIVNNNNNKNNQKKRKEDWKIKDIISVEV
jgi:hypothetical protein